MFLDYFNYESRNIHPVTGTWVGVVDWNVVVQDGANIPLGYQTGPVYSQSQNDGICTLDWSLGGLVVNLGSSSPMSALYIKYNQQFPNNGQWCIRIKITPLVKKINNRGYTMSGLIGVQSLKYSASVPDEGLDYTTKPISASREGEIVQPVFQFDDNRTTAFFNDFRLLVTYVSINHV